MVRIGILGAGKISATMAQTLQGMRDRGDDIQLYAAASRSHEKAGAFAAQWGFEKTYDSYEAMLCDPNVDMVYIGTPHSHHAQHMLACIDHGKPALCEKAFTGNARQAQEVLAHAKSKGVLVAEAIWTRYMPSRQMIDGVIASGDIGQPFLLTANLGYKIADVERIIKPELAGGALLDVGVYTLNFASMAFGDNVARMESSVAMLPSGVDHTESISLYYADGKIAQLMATAMTRTDRRGVVYGTDGYLTVDNINNPQSIQVYDTRTGEALVKTLRVPEQITGYEYEVEAFVRALKAGKLECDEMPHAETLRIMRMMDDLRAQWNMRYPFD